MKQRCLDKNHHAYPRYGGRGITICPEWLDFRGFLRDMGIRPSGLTLERKNNAGGYNKENCVWATRAAQSRNTRFNVWLTVGDERLCLTDWSRKTGIGVTTLLWRLNKGLEPADIIDPDTSHGKAARRKTHCPAGHPYNSKNTYQSPGGRKCRVCCRIRARALRASGYVPPSRRK